MSTYSGRRGPNVSLYLRELNTAPSQENSAEDVFSIDDDLAMFTNTQFFDFDSGQNTDFQPPTVKPDVESQLATAAEELAPGNSAMGSFSSLDFMQGDFGFADVNTFSASSLPTVSDGLGNVQHVQPSTTGAFALSPTRQSSNYLTPTSRISEKRKVPDRNSKPSRPLSFEEASRLAAEEDKRRRNTAASARFRIKKKQREQALEKSAKEMTEKVTVLESRIQQLETENKWLKNLIMEKNEGNEDIAALWKEFSSKQLAEKGRPAEKVPPVGVDDNPEASEKEE